MTRFALLLALCLLPGLPLHAQDEMDEGPATAQPAPGDKAPKTDPAKSAPKPKDAAPASAADDDTPPAPAPGSMDDMPVAELQALDKITARVSTIEVKTGDTTTFGSLSLTVKACRKAPAENTPEAAAFLQVWEQKPGEESSWVYSGWMFASSPSLAAMDHPVYDIWLVDCKKAATSSDSPAPAPLPASKP